MLVVDANVVAYLVVVGDMTAQARHLWTVDPDWRAPRLLSYELTNVFSRLLAHEAFDLRTAQTGLTTALSVVRMTASEPSPSRVLEIAARLRLSAYDAYYVATAEMERTLLITEDKRLLHSAPQMARSIAAALSLEPCPSPTQSEPSDKT